MTRSGALVAAGLVVGVNAFALARVAANRAGQPDAQMLLTERELPVAYSWRQAETETSAVALRIDVDHPAWRRPEGSDLDTLRWLDAAKLAELGFDVRLPGNSADAASFLARQLTRKAYAVIEYQGPVGSAFRAALERTYGPGARPGPRSAEAWESQAARREIQGGSRLFIVDAGRDPAALRTRYPDRRRYLILPAEVAAQVDPGGDGPGAFRATGRVALLVNEVVVPRRMQSGLPAPSRREGWAAELHEPRYEVTLRAGSLHEPWIEALRPLAP